MNVWNDEPILKNGKWYILVVNTETANIVDEILGGDTKEEALEAIKNHQAKQLEELNIKKEEQAIMETSLLETMFDQKLVSELHKSNLLPKSDDEIKEELKKFDDEYQKESLTCANDAKSLLVSIASLYLKGKMIENSDYLKFRLKIEQEALSSVLFQLSTSKRAIHKISQEIHSGTYTPRLIEVLTGLQRIVLDISKFQHQYMLSLESSIKELGKDSDALPDNSIERVLPFGESNNEEDGVTTNSRRRLLDNLNKMIDEAKENKVPMSKNSNIPVDPTVEYSEMNNNFEKSSDDDEDLTLKTGLESYE